MATARAKYIRSRYVQTPRRKSPQAWRREERARRAKLHPIGRWHVRLRDTVEVNWGARSGLRGEVVRRDEDGQSVVVRPLGGAQEEDVELHFSQVSLIDPASDKRTSVSWRYLESGERVRIAESGAVVPVVPRKTPEVEPVPPRFAPFVTRHADVIERTYVPLPDESQRPARRARERTRRQERRASGAAAA